jgi:adenosylcobinamide-GDP ribazoletransferase
MRNAAKTFLIALQFFTRIPVTGRIGRWADYSPARLNRAAAYFPLVGFVVGLVSVAGMALAIAAFSSLGTLGWALSAMLSLVLSLWVTGAFHEDGLADTFDALGGHVDREKALAIMKDSRLGTYGTVALMVALGTKVLLMASVLSLDATLALGTVVVAHGVSRLGPLVVMAWLPYVADADTSKSKPLAQGLTVSGAMLAGASALLGTVVCGAICAWWDGIAASSRAGVGVTLQLLGAATLGWVLASAWCVRWFRQRLAGYTGDCLGATQQLAELLIWMTVLLSVLAD